MFCSTNCHREWCTQLHFILVDWNVPNFSNHGKSYGAPIQFVGNKQDQHMNYAH